MPAAKAKSSTPFPGRISRRAGIAIAALLIAAVVAVVAWNGRWQQTLPVVAVAASDATPRSEALARDLFVKLGTLEHVGAGKWVLADPQSTKSSPDLVFKVAQTGSAAQLQAGLTLVDGEGNSLLWSREFAQSDGSEADVRQQVALAAGLALLCSLEAREDHGLPPELFKRYIGSCAEAALGSEMDSDKAVTALRSIIAERPRFKAAWALLLSAQASVAAIAELGSPSEAASHRRTLLQDLEKARKIAPNLPEIEMAEIQLLSPMDFAGRLERIGRAKAEAPEKSVIWGYECTTLKSVGRVIEAIAAARRAAELEPLSPAAANEVIMTLAYAGEFEAARKELARAERNWAGTKALRDGQWAFHLRFGDPKFAMALAEQSTNLYLQARLAPTPEKVNAMMAELELASPSVDAEFGYAIQALAEFDRTDDVYRWFDRAPVSTLARQSYLFFRPAFADVWRDPRFMSVAKRNGLLNYWQKSGKWPDFCYDPKLPYDCRKEAAKLGA
ncbi:hypothetical protein LZ496_02370 [Sphingomonas sp. NSE70-1]|uniref:Tetratricopeptide repeat-containing protein n=1 Tax=Sphingomonas caseinilyticus TaxID=2908205 RepID=A0ABT0RRK0_9SPHN|nr:hypothetical protein [Sphingomonas caseinilyticus]MCL6697630.1 hypothetical protein [Sphingomonas caseinilyticus]